MRLALTDLFKARWTDMIHEEWITALLRREDKPYTRKQLESTRDLMDAHVRDAKVFGHETLIESLELPDPDDRHVLAAAIRCNADAIVTFNIKDFPKEVLERYSIEVIHPDDFVYYQIELSPSRVCKAIRNQRKSLKNPPKTKEEFLAILLKQQLPQSVLALKEYVDLL